MRPNAAWNRRTRQYSFGVIPTWSHSRSWGYGPSGLVSIVLVLLVILLLTGRL